MPSLSPFIGLRYDPARSGPLARLITPPYDVISPAARRDLAAASPFNLVHLILPEAQDGRDAYAAAAARLRAWRAAGVLRADEAPTCTLHRQTWTDGDGRRRARTGLIAVLLLAEADSDGVRPHERTLEGPRSDRMRLTLATRAHLSPVFVLALDPGGALEALLAGAASDMLPAGFADGDGVRHQAASTSEPGFLDSVATLTRDMRMIIADGHHRYESARACRDRLRQDLGPGHPQAREACRVLVEVVSLASPGLEVLAYHRLVPRLPIPVAQFEDRLLGLRGARAIDLPEAHADAARRLTSLLGESVPGTVAAVSGPARRAILIPLDAPPVGPEALAGLDVARLHRHLLQDMLRMGEEEIESGDLLRFTRDAGGALDQVASGSCQAAFLLRPTPLADLVRVTGAGLRMPQKSTYFHPKVPAGLVLHGFE